MKIETSIALSEELLLTIDDLLQPPITRSDFVEKALWVFITQMRDDYRHAHDLAIINAHADALNEEALDVLAYQVAL